MERPRASRFFEPEESALRAPVTANLIQSRIALHLAHVPDVAVLDVLAQKHLARGEAMKL